MMKMKTGKSVKPAKAGRTTKPAKASGTGKAPVPQPKVPAQWLYLNEKEVSVDDLLVPLLSQFPDTEVWKEAGVLEIPLAEKSSMDMEMTEPVMDDDYSNEFLKENGTKSLYMVTIRPEDYEKAREAMKLIISSCGGFFCGDTEDFSPAVK